MSLSATEIAMVVGELETALVGGWIQKIFQPQPEIIVLEIRVPGQTYRLLISANPDTARLHLIRNTLPNPPSPPAFCQLLRARIQGARIDAISQVNHDRIAELRLTASDGACRLMAELIGRKADLLLIDQRDRVAATLNSRAERVGKPYEPPRPLSKKGDWPLHPRLEGDSPLPISVALEEQYGRREEQLSLDRRRKDRQASLRQSIKKRRRRITALEQDLQHAARYRDYARYGELLKANLGNIAKGQREMVVQDYFEDTVPELTIPLDPSKSPSANMEDYFRKHRKHLAAEREIQPRLETLRREVVSLEQDLVACQAADWRPPPEALGSIRRAREATPRKPIRQPRQGPFRKFLSADGLPIYVGRNARENEELTFRVAKGDDLWLHARGAPGSHVVVRLQKGTDPPQETMRDAATLALLYSDLKKSGKGEVIYTRRKWVRKAKGQQLGAVTLTQEKSIFLVLDQSRLARLKEESVQD